MTRKRRYYVTTWDSDKDGFTPQQGVRTGPYTLFGLRKAIRKLRDMGYPCDYSSKGSGDPSVRVFSPEAFAASVRRLNRFLASKKK